MSEKKQPDHYGPANTQVIVMGDSRYVVGDPEKQSITELDARNILNRILEARKYQNTISTTSAEEKAKTEARQVRPQGKVPDIA